MKKLIQYLGTERIDNAHMASTPSVIKKEYFDKKIAEIDALLDDLKGAGFVFADWLAEVGYKKDYSYKECWNKDEINIFIFDTDFGVDVNSESLFTGCLIPKTRHEAEIIFNAFNLLQPCPK